MSAPTLLLHAKTWHYISANRRLVMVDLTEREARKMVLQFGGTVVNTSNKPEER